MAKKERLLRQCSLFSELEEGEIARLLPCIRAKSLTVAPGEELLPREEGAVMVAVVLAGEASVTDEGGKTVVTLGAGDHFGAGYACVGRALPVAVAAVTDCEIVRFDCRRALTTCDHSCKSHHRLMRALVRSVAEESLEREEKLAILTQKTTKDKLMAYLRRQARLQGSNEFTIPLDRQGLADYLGVERSAMSTELGKLRRDGVLECKKSWFKLL